MDLLSAQKMLNNNLTTLPAMTVSDALAPSQDEASGFDASEPPVSNAVNVTIDDGEPCRVWNNNVGYQSTSQQQKPKTHETSTNVTATLFTTSKRGYMQCVLSNLLLLPWKLCTTAGP